MKYGIIPTSLTERVAIAAKKVPLVLVDMIIPLIQTRALMNLVRLGVFEQLAGGAQSAGSLAQRIGADADCLALALRVAESAGYLRREATAWALTEPSRRMLLPGAPQDSRETVMFTFHEWDMVEQMDSLLTTGRGIDFHGTLEDEAVWGHYQGSMLELASSSAPMLAGMVHVPAGARLMLDVAGSHGMMGAAICRRHPPLKSIVLDLPAALPHARRLAERAAITDVVEHREADMLGDDYPEGADLVLFSNILHHFTPEQNVTILRRAYKAMKPGATLAVFDVERRPQDAGAELAADAMALFFRLTSNSATFTAKEYERWAAEAGFREIKCKRHMMMPSMLLCCGTK